MASADFQALQERLGHAFSRPELLREALTHPSLVRKPSVAADLPDYEKLEFLGDRVLGLVAAELLIRHYPQEGEGDIAKRHAAVVQRKALAHIAEEIGLGDALLLSQGESDSGGRYKETILADALEAVIAALYLDGGLAAASRFIVARWTPLVAGRIQPPQDPKTALQEWAQAHERPLPVYQTLGQSGPAHAPQFTVQVSVVGLIPAEATASSKRAAEKEAAEKMLTQIGSDL